MNEPNAGRDQERLMRLEESHAFAERNLEQLSEEIAELNRRMADVLARMSRLEARFGTSVQKALEGDSDPTPGPP